MQAGARRRYVWRNLCSRYPRGSTTQCLSTQPRQLLAAIAESLEHTVQLAWSGLARGLVGILVEPGNHVFPHHLACGRHFEKPASRGFGNVRVAVPQTLRVAHESAVERVDHV